MKIKFQIKHLAAVLTIIIGLAIAGHAQMVGGYRTFAADSEDAVQAGGFAVEAHNEKAKTSLQFEKVLKAERQLVAGMNFRLCIEVNDDADAKHILVVVYRNLQNEFSLTSWQETECAPKEEN